MQVSESVQLICPVTVMWRLPTIKVCRGGENDNQYCETDEFCGSGFCLFMPMNTVLQVSTNGGQLYSGPSTSSILFYMQPQIQTIFPARVVKDCGGSGAGSAMDCEWGASWQDDVLPASETNCGKETFCPARQKVEFTLAPGLVTGQCNACNKVYINDRAFSKVKCRFEVENSKTKFVLADAVYTANNGYSTVRRPEQVRVPF